MTIKKIIEVTKSYVIRHFFKDNNYIKPLVLDMSTMNLNRITSKIQDDDIESILFCDFYEEKNMAYNTVKFFKENPDLLITDHNLPVKNFKYWYGIFNNKLIINTLDKLDNDIIVMPVRNIKSYIDKPFNDIKIKDGIIYCVNDQYEIQLPYDQSNSNVGKCILVSEDGCSLFVYGVKYFHEELNNVKQFLKQHPSYPILVDNGRYLFYFFDECAKKDAFLCGGFANIDQMYTIGSIKK